MDGRGFDKLCGQVSRYFNTSSDETRLFIVIPCDNRRKGYILYEGLKHWIMENRVKIFQFDYAIYSKKFIVEEIRF